MKNILYTIVLITLAGCGNSGIDAEEYKRLEQEYVLLKKQNQVLKDSLSSYKEDFLRSQILLGISDDMILKVGKKNNIKLFFNSFSVQLPKYEIYRVEGGKEFKVGSSTETRFNYEFIPKSVKDNEINLKVKIPFKNDTIVIPAGMMLPVEE